MITQITNNYNSVNNLVATPPRLETATDQNKHKHAIHKNRLVTATCKQQTSSIVTTDYTTNTIFKKTIETHDVCLFKSTLYSAKNISMDFKNPMILTKYTNLIIDYKADACLIELLDFLLEKNIKQVLDHNHELYYYICDNPQLQQTVLNKYYYAVGCLQIYNMLLHAISINNKDVAIQTFNILLKKFPIDYTAKQYINKYHNPIVYAIKQDKFDIFQRLVNMAPKYLVSIIENDATPLMVAAQNKNSAFLKQLLRFENVRDFINYQNKESKLAIFLAMEYGNDDNVKILLDHAPLLVFEKLHGKDKTVLAEIFETYPNYFATLLNNNLIAKESTNPIFFAELLCEKDNSAYKLLISLKKQTTFANKQLTYDNQVTNHNNSNKITDALIDYKPKKKCLFNLDHMNIDSYYTEILNKEMSDLLHFILPKLDNLAVYIKTKQYYIDSTTINKTFSYGDENASITLINWLIYFGAKKIKVIISPPDTSTPNSRRYLSKIVRRNYNKQKLFCLKKLSRLFPAIKSDNIKPQKIIISNCNLHVGFVDDNRFMNNLLFNNKVRIKKHMHDIELLKYNGIVVSFSANETYKELVADDLIIIKPFAFAKKCEQIHTNLYIDKKNKSVFADIKSLNNTPYSIIPEIKTDIELKYNSDNHILKWLTAKLASNNSGANIANIINIIQLCLKQHSIDHSVIYGIHHRNIKGNEYNTIRNWITALDSFRYNRNTATVISIFPNNILLDMDMLTYNRNDIVFLSFSNTNIINDFKLAIAEKKIIIFNFPSLAKQIFYFLIRNSNLPMLTEGANTTSFLLQEGLPYLSLLPNFTTKIPYNIGNPLQSFLIEALSYKLVLNTSAKEQLTELYNLVKQKKFTEAQSLMDELIEQHNKQKSFLSYLWQQPLKNPTKDIKFTAYKLITTGNNLSSNAYNILLQALANDFDSIANYIKQVTKTNSQEKEHIEIIKHKLQNNFNNAVITSLYKFFKEKNISKELIK